MREVAQRVESDAAQLAGAGNGQETRDAPTILLLAAQHRAIGTAATKGHGGAFYRVCWHELWERE
eukprot:9836327-Lingulodinium_polyedra.AAC.1